MNISAEKITSAMAARLATSLLCHVLFLKGQVPFPVVQLTRIPGGTSNPRAGKKREELMNAVDTLSSHLQTTFAALSTAYALRQERSNNSDSSKDALRPPATYMAFVLGPSVGAAKARVMLALDGLEVKPWGTRGDDALAQGSVSDVGESDSDSESPSTSSLEDEQDDEQGDTEDETGENAPPRLRLAESISAPFARLSLSPHTPSYDAEQQALRAADRLLSRTLANACAEEDGGLSAELAPTQTHVLLRAPRCFVHPAWVPRQNLSRTLDGQLQAFLDDALRRPATEQQPQPPPRRRAGVKTEGVWVASAHAGPGAPAALAAEAGMHEDDEMIWWAWDGKVVGFADW
ncbi:hypothetical protein PHLGIDRAFT_22200 [Phlebiopsis gigantea 11061_1 CR5-6]|uniref:Uncharacterized protein n=1 Tax=Phlebiopsis gigantea (strain 11061_1 CR5-6) TaxID=745531 RepID=A0A0C3NYN0_PHLG1|nr:hypothetical protein PHLGIDRAFT_22200 [Phlebiopsis gigantea 11061_1 CR5-6]